MKILLLALLLSPARYGWYGNFITPEERMYAIAQLEDSQQKLLDALAGLTQEQLNFKPSPEKWSIAEVVEHIGLAETGIGQIVLQTLKTATDSTRRTEITVTDGQIRPILTNRNGKVQSPEKIKPTGRFSTIEQAIGFFKNARQRNIELIKTTTENLRDRYWQHPATGTIDLYQSILLIAAHCERHTAQIKEIKTAVGYPDN